MLKKFLERIEQDPQLKERVKALDADPKTTPADYVALAAEYGCQITEQELAPAELSEDELDAVAGGGVCACVMGGGGFSIIGPHDYKDTRCVCFAGGDGDSVL